jgi:imidazolonepropionase-like amidohydrolase
MKAGIFAAAIGMSVITPSMVLAQTTIIHAGRLIDVPGEAPRGPSTIIVEDGRIVSVVDGHAQIPEGADFIDLREKTVLPGLIDSHVHLTSDAGGLAGQ